MGSSFWECSSIADILFVLKLEQIINTLDYTTGSHVVAASDYHLLMKEMVSYFADDNFQGCDHILILLAFFNFRVLINCNRFSATFFLLWNATLDLTTHTHLSSLLKFYKPLSTLGWQEDKLLQK